MRDAAPFFATSINTNELGFIEEIMNGINKRGRC